MRKLLVASQKGGVGKTTTSINLAAAAALAGTRVLLLDADPLSSVSAMLNLGSHPHRRTLREAGLDLPGFLVCDFLPSLDVLSPYEAGACSDEDLDEILRLLATPQVQAAYGCLVVDSPPFLGANPGQLVRACDGVVVVMRAEPMAYRTLPAFLELVLRSRAGRPLKTHGVLLTLPDGESEGGRWERELRGRLGGRALAQVIPFDEEVGQAFDRGRIVVEASPEAAAAVQYTFLAEALQLAVDPLPLTRTAGAAPLLAAAAAVPQLVGAAAQGDGFHSSSPVAAPDREVPDCAPEDEAPVEGGSPVGVDMPSFADLSLIPEPSLALPAFQPPPAARSRLAPVPTGPEEKETPARAAASTPPSGLAATRGWLVGVGMAVVVGVGLRLVRLPDFMLPMAVGVAVTTAVVLVLRLLLLAQDAPPKTVPLVVSPSRKVKKVENKDGRRDAATRLTSLARASASGSYRKPKRK